MAANTPEMPEPTTQTSASRSSGSLRVRTTVRVAVDAYSPARSLNFAMREGCMGCFAAVCSFASWK
jgi:hypothetical protein